MPGGVVTATASAFYQLKMPTLKQTMPSIELSENHRRSISITLQLLDEALCAWNDWSDGKVKSGVLYRELDTLSPNQKSELRNKIGTTRQLMIRLRDDLDLPLRNVATSRSISGHASLLWEMLTELNSRGLTGYGTVSEELARYLDPIGDALTQQLSSITEMLSQPSETTSQA